MMQNSLNYNTSIACEPAGSDTITRTCKPVTSPPTTWCQEDETDTRHPEDSVRGTATAPRNQGLTGRMPQDIAPMPNGGQAP